MGILRSTLTLLLLSTVALSSASAQDPTSENNQRLKRVLERFPDADASGDGLLTMQEARTYRDAKDGASGQRVKPKRQIIAPSPTHENIKYGPYDRNLIDLWIPESNKPAPLLVFIHGGGFRGGSKEGIRTVKDVEQALASGLAFASIQYRFGIRVPGDENDPQKAGIQYVLRDSARAIQFLRFHAAKYAIDKTRIACYGGSAGAGTSLWLAFHDDLADPGNADPILRESSRIAAAGMLNGQFSYDLEAWDKYFSRRFGPDVGTYRDVLGMSSFSGFYGLTPEQYAGEAGTKWRADVDMYSLITPDDPPVYIWNKNNDALPDTLGRINHHPLHAQLIEGRCMENGIETRTLLPGLREDDKVAMRANPRAMMDFFAEKLSTEPRR